MLISSKKASIAVGNVITGIFNFLTIGIPEKWRIAGQSMNSDVFSTTKQGNIRWVDEGEVEHYIQSKDGLAFLRIIIKRDFKEFTKFKKSAKAIQKEKIMFSSHEALVYNYFERFLWKKREVLGIYFQCNETKRTVLIELVNGNSWIEEILSYLKDSQCHLSKNYEKALEGYSKEDFEHYT